MGNTSSGLHRSSTAGSGPPSPPRSGAHANDGAPAAAAATSGGGRQGAASGGAASTSRGGAGTRQGSGSGSGNRADKDKDSNDRDDGNKQLAASLLPQDARVDNGHLLPLSNIYPTSPQDWLHDVVQRLIVERKLAPFYRGLEDWDESDEFDRDEIDAALDNVGDERSKQWRRTLYTEHDRKAEAAMYKKAAECPICFLCVRQFGLAWCITLQKTSFPRSPLRFCLPFQSLVDSPANARCPFGHVSPSANDDISELGRYYPPLINTSRCCDQPICTECFVQIKRADPTTTDLKVSYSYCPCLSESPTAAEAVNRQRVPLCR